MAGHFGTAFRRARLAAKKTLKEVADLLKVSVPYVSDVELGRRQPFSQEDIIRVAKFVGCEQDVDQLLNLAVRDRGEIVFTPHTDQTRDLLVALNRQIDGLDQKSLDKLREILKRQAEN